MERFIYSLEMYVNNGLQPGSFLQAILTNDLMGAIARADDEALPLLKQICKYVYNEIPMNAWGSSEAVSRHLASFK